MTEYRKDDKKKKCTQANKVKTEERKAHERKEKNVKEEEVRSQSNVGQNKERRLRI